MFEICGRGEESGAKPSVYISQVRCLKAVNSLED